MFRWLKLNEECCGCCCRGAGSLVVQRVSWTEAWRVEDHIAWRRAGPWESKGEIIRPESRIYEFYALKFYSLNQPFYNITLTIHPIKLLSSISEMIQTMNKCSLSITLEVSSCYLSINWFFFFRWNQLYNRLNVGLDLLDLLIDFEIIFIWLSNIVSLLAIEKV